MKSLKSFKIIIGISAAFVLFLSSLLSCDNAERYDQLPTITSVNDIVNDQPVDMGSRATMYILHGKGLDQVTEVYFNGVKAPFNNALATYNSLFVTIPEDVPYDMSTSEQNIKLVSTGGSITYAFQIQQPLPTVTDFYPVAGEAGTIVTLKGNVLVNPTSVRFGNTEAEVISSSETEIQVKVPEGLTKPEAITITTSGGVSETTPAKFGFSYIIYDDSLNTSWWISSWSGTDNLENTENVSRGTSSILHTTDAWGGFQIGAGAPVSLAGATAIKLSVYVKTEGSFNIQINGTANKTVSLKKDTWYNLTIPLSEFGNPETLEKIVIQEFNGQSNVIYIDDLGVI